MQEFQKFLDAIKNQDHRSLMSLCGNKKLLNMQDENGDTLLHHALRLDIKMAQMLIGYGVNVNIKNNDGITAIDMVRKINDPFLNTFVNIYGNNNIFVNIDGNDKKCDNKENTKEFIITNKNGHKYKPKNLEQLKKLVTDESVHLGSIDTSLITDMGYLFDESKRKNFDGIETWDTSNVKSMNDMFRSAKYFNHNINSWNVSNVKDMSYMFYEAEKFNQPLNSWDVSNVADMERMFLGAKSFNQPLNQWHTSNVEKMSHMFFKAENFNQDLNNWDTSSVVDMSGMFENALAFNGNISSWDTSNVESMSGMFENATSFNQDLNNWNVFNVEHMQSIFYKATSFHKDNIKEWRFNNKKIIYIADMFDDIPLSILFKVYSNFNTKIALSHLKAHLRESVSNKNVKEIYLEALKYYDKCIKEFVKMYEDKHYNILKELIENKEAFIKENNQLSNEENNQPSKQLDKNGFYKPKNRVELINLIKSKVKLSNIDTSLITDMSEVFQDSRLKKFDGIETWDVSNVTSMVGMFFNARYFNHNINNWDVSNVTRMDSMFRGCKNFNQPLDKWNISKVKYMYKMFEFCENFNQPLNKWDVSSVINMEGMFEFCENFNQPLDKWDVSNVISMKAMFYNCKNFNQPLDKWDVSNVEIMFRMFERCKNFNQPLDNWNTSKVKNMNIMFEESGMDDNPPFWYIPHSRGY